MKNAFYKVKLLLLLISIFIISNYSFSQAIKGNGNVVTQDRSLTPFRGIVATGSFELFLIQGDKQKVIIEADENLHNLFITNVRNETLDIQVVGEVKKAKAIKVYVTFLNLNHLIAIGAVDVRADSLIKSNELEVFVSGVSSIKAKFNVDDLAFELTDGSYGLIEGNANKLDIRITDEAELNAFDLESKKCNVKSSGYSDAKIFVMDELKLRVTGAGNLYYKGDPKITDRIFSGTGFIIKRKNN